MNTAARSNVARLAWHFKGMLPPLYAGIAMCLLAGAGCSTWDLKSKMPWADPEAKVKVSKFDKPTRIVAIWTPTTLNQPGKPVTRGFGGRLYFYNDDGTTIPVEGQLMVYAYDDTARKQSRGNRSSTGGLDEPDRKYAFTAEQFSTHYSPTDLGASYSVWVPWGPMEGPTCEISLVPVFTSASGNIAMGQTSRHVLKGRAAPSSDATSSNNGPEANKDATQEIADGVMRMEQSTKQTELRSTKIKLPEQTAERLARLGASTLEEPVVARLPPPRTEAGMSQPNYEPQSLQPAIASAVEKSTAAMKSSVINTNFNGEMKRDDRWHNPGITGAAPAVPRPWSSTMPRQDRFERPKFPAPTLPDPQSVSGPALMQPSPTGQPFAPASSPAPIDFSRAPVNSSAAFQTAESPR